MSYKYTELKNVEGIRKVKWDGLWHVMYKWGKRDTYDRVDRKEAMRVLRRLEKAFKNNYR